MQWQSGITILGVYSSNDSQNAWIHFKNRLGVVGWRKIIPNAADGVSNMVAIAAASQMSGAIVQLLISNAGEIAGISSL